MKSIIKIFIAIALLATYCIPAKANETAGRQFCTIACAAAAQKVYYVVVGCYDSLEEAKKAMEYLPDFLVSPVYETTVKGKTEYRICLSCHTTKAKALEEIKKLKEVFSDRPFGIWKSKGLARCVYCPIAMNGDPMQPLEPK